MRKHYGKFISDVQTNGNRRRLGSFATAEEAALCRARHIGAKQASAETQKADVWKLDSVMNGNFESLVNDQFFSDLNVTPLASAAAAGRPTVPVAAPGLCLDGIDLSFVGCHVSLFDADAAGDILTEGLQDPLTLATGHVTRHPRCHQGRVMGAPPSDAPLPAKRAVVEAARTAWARTDRSRTPR